MKRIAFILLIMSLTLAVRAEVRVLRTPDVNGDLVVFASAGDIWSVSALGGTARRLTSHPGIELFPKISPDGQWVAFSGEYSGSRQVFVIPSQGGEPRQLTWYNDVGVMPPRGGYDHVTLDWTPDSKSVLFRGNRTPFGDREGKYFLVDLAGGLERPLPITEGGIGSFSPDGKQICFTPIGREFRTWKRYKGGRAADVWIFDLEKVTARKITDFQGTDHLPNWQGDKIYYVSDQDLVLNLWCYDLKSGEHRQVTTFKDYDVLWPSGDKGRIAFEQGGYLHVLDLATNQSRRLTVDLPSDHPNRLTQVMPVAKYIDGSALSPSGKEVIFSARGDLYSVPAEKGSVKALTRSPGVREMSPAWSPDGRYLAYYSDESGEYEVYLLDRTSQKTRQLTQGSKRWRYPAVWSPDSRMLAYADRDQRLMILTVADGRETVADQAASFDFNDYKWSPDSAWLTYTKGAANGNANVWVYSLAGKRAFALTEATYGDSDPVFSACGKYLFFLSQRDFNLNFSSFEFDYHYGDGVRIYALPLKAGLGKLFPPEEEREPLPAVSGTEAKKADKTAKPAAISVTIDETDLFARVEPLPLPGGDYADLRFVPGGLLYQKSGAYHVFSIEKRKEEKVLEGIRVLDLSADGKQMLFARGRDYGVCAATPGQSGDKMFVLTGLRQTIEPMKEWLQIFRDGWRIYRDWFYVKNLHGVDWPALYEKYLPLVKGIGHRADLDYIFGEMLAETNVGHAYVNWGDFPRVERVEGGLLGAEFQPDGKRYRIRKILKGENWQGRTRSPLTEAGVDVKEGDYVLSINGEELTTADNPYRLLLDRADRETEIVVSARADGSSPRTSRVTPVSSELELFYLNWVNERRGMVERLSQGRIGYFHLPNTAVEGNRELFKGMYAYHDKEALIIDDRYNGGGFIPVVMTELLKRKPLNHWLRAGLDLRKDPGISHDGPKAMLINHYASSGGDALPYYFKKSGLGPLIGTRTWGGLVGISGNPGFVDGGFFNVPTFGFVGTDGELAVEGIGVSPDIEVVDSPDALAKGQDPTLEKAIEVLLKELEKNPVKKVKKPAEPDRSKWIEQEIK
jgi:tricorn protease